MDLFLLDCPTYDDYLDTFVTRNDIRYVRNVRLCRMLVELGYRSSTEIYTPEQFEAHKVAAHESLWPTIKATVFFSENIKPKDPVLQQLAQRERPNMQKMISVNCLTNISITDNPTKSPSMKAQSNLSAHSYKNCRL